MLRLLFFCLLVHQSAADLKKLKEYLNDVASMNFVDHKECKDFYNYFCGTWNQSVSARPRNSSKLLNDFDQKLNKVGNKLPNQYSKAKWLYESCKEFEGLDKERTTEVLVSAFSEMTGGVSVPLLDHFWQPDGKDPFRTDAIVEKMSKSNLLVQLDTYRTEWSKYELRIRPVSFNFSSITRASVNTWLSGLGALSRKQQLEVDGMIALLRSLQEIQSKARTSSEEAVAMPLADLLWRVPQIDWQPYLQAASGHQTQLMVEVLDLESLKQIGMAIQNLQFSHPSAFYNLLAYRFFTTVGQLKRKEVCLSKFAPFLNPLAQYLWREDNEKAVEKRLDILIVERGVRNSFSDMILKASWLDKESQLNSLSHLDNLDAKYLDNQSDEDKLEALAKDLSISEGNNVLENFFALVAWNRTRLATAETGDLGHLPFFSDALSWSDQKSLMIFGLPLLQEPLFSPEYPAWAKYGALGSRIGRELAKSFGSEESVSRIFTKQGIVAYADKMACFKSQSNRNCKDCTSEIQETIANILGINASFAAFQQITKAKDPSTDFYTDEERIEFVHDDHELFMLAWAKPYCDSDPLKVKRYRNLINSVVRGLVENFGQVPGCFDEKTKCDLFPVTFPVVKQLLQ